MKKAVSFILIVGLVVMVFGFTINSVKASDLPCFDVYSACVDKHGYTDGCESLWQNCMNVMYPAVE